MRLTLTGVDESNSLPELQSLDAELGFLYSATPEGRRRYPSLRWIKETSRLIHRCALHVCGSGARRELVDGTLDGMLTEFQRIQVNGMHTVQQVEAICVMFPDHTIITQHNAANADLLHLVETTNHVVLVDASGGRGISPTSWDDPRSNNSKPVGYAGGLGPDNLHDQLKEIHEVARQGWWVDMEGKLRDEDDRFSIELAVECCRIMAANGYTST